MEDKQKIAESVQAKIGRAFYDRAVDLLLNESREAAGKLLARSGIGGDDIKATLDYEEERFLVS